MSVKIVNSGKRDYVCHPDQTIIFTKMEAQLLDFWIDSYEKNPSSVQLFETFAVITSYQVYPPPHIQKAMSEGLELYLPDGNGNREDNLNKCFDVSGRGKNHYNEYKDLNKRIMLAQEVRNLIDLFGIRTTDATKMISERLLQSCDKNNPDDNPPAARTIEKYYSEHEFDIKSIRKNYLFYSQYTIRKELRRYHPQTLPDKIAHLRK